jgi:nitronate monooxygenase
MKIKSQLSEQLNLRFPLLMAPLFLVSNEKMVTSAIESGIAGCFPSLNFREPGELERVLDNLNAVLLVNEKGSYGVNLIVQKTNPVYEKHLAVCVQKKVPFYITSLGNPQKVIEAAHAYGAKVYCDVTNLVHAQKAYSLGCDGFIAVSSGAGGHAGPNPLNVLVPALRSHFPDKPVIAAGGLSDGETILSAFALGSDAVYIGTRFIASEEAGVKQEYKQAVVDSGMDDIVMTDRISGTPCAIINTPYARKIGYKQNWFEKWMSNNSTTKKYFKMLVQLRGLRQLEKSVKPGNYQTLWTAGKSVELVHEILPVKEIVAKLIRETEESYSGLESRVS